jgi:hypothetical protein
MTNTKPIWQTSQAKLQLSEFRVSRVAGFSFPGSLVAGPIQAGWYLLNKTGRFDSSLVCSETYWGRRSYGTNIILRVRSRQKLQFLSRYDQLKKKKLTHITKTWYIHLREKSDRLNGVADGRLRHAADYSEHTIHIRSWRSAWWLACYWVEGVRKIQSTET